MDLEKLIEDEIKRNNELKRVSDSECSITQDVAKQLRVEDLYVLSPKTIGFQLKVDLEILRSSSYVLNLINLYVEENKGDFEKKGKLERFNGLIPYCEQDIKRITERVLGIFNRSYEMSW